MTITEYYECYKTKAVKKKIEYPLVIQEGTANTFSEFYDNCLFQHIKDISTNALQWHEMLVEYTKHPDAIFWVRRYESSSKTEKALHGGRWVNRRACKTEHPNGFSYVFVSNFEAHEIFNMVRLGVKPDLEEFLKLMKAHLFPMHYDAGKSCEESDIALYPKVGDPRYGALTKNHWYLAHILGVNEPNDYICAIDFDKICPRGSVTDWDNRNGYIVRRMKKDLSKDEEELIKAHFLRFVDPLNYYVVPGKNYQNNHNYHFKNNQIGEYPALNDYMSTKYADIYGRKTMDDFRAAVFAKVMPDIVNDESIDIAYAPTPYIGESAYTTDEQYAAATYYLQDEKATLGKVQSKTLGISENKGNGSYAKKVLNGLGIDTSRNSKHKGMLKNTDIQTAIDNATGTFKKTLEKIKELGL